MFTKELLDFVINSVRTEEQVKATKFKELEDKTKPVHRDAFCVEKRAGDLVEPAKRLGVKHREREKHYTAELEKAEAVLKEKGISIEVFDQTTNTYMNYGHTASGQVTGINLGNFGNVSQQIFQPRVDQKLMDDVKNSKGKMLEHRAKAEQFEKYARAYKLDTERMIKLTIEDVHFFRLGDEVPQGSN